MKYSILIVEDEPDIVRLIQNRLDTQKFNVTIAMDGKEALEYIRSNHYDLLTLDIMLPHVDGLTLCENIRQQHKDSLILIISALDTVKQKEKAYVLGADDYIPKPFSPKLVAVKIESLLKRRVEILNAPLPFYANIQHDEALKQFYIQGHPLMFTVSEYTVFKILFETPKKVFSKEELSQILYNEDIGNIDKEGIGTHIYQIRKKIAVQSKDDIIKTVRNVGYTLYEC
ncbi:response regulator transcription factor [Sulfurovum sp.]|uniref:response regulator transcription factor n=1 Tax=Sulfurovum sp. TaxID=1969726 RepID=UPI0025F4A174|nr:response regulator transcription factor [Sulfurovum sp.]